MRIPQQVAKHASDVTVSLDPRTWSARLHNAVAKNIRGGLIRGNGSAAQIAVAYRQGIGAPWVRTHSYGDIWWGNMPKDCDFWDVLTDLIITEQLRSPPGSWHPMDRLAKLIADRPQTGGIYYGGQKEDIAIVIRPTLPEVEMPTGVFTIKYEP